MMCTCLHKHERSEMSAYTGLTRYLGIGHVRLKDFSLFVFSVARAIKTTLRHYNDKKLLLEFFMHKALTSS